MCSDLESTWKFENSKSESLESNWRLQKVLWIRSSESVSRRSTRVFQKYANVPNAHLHTFTLYLYQKVNKSNFKLQWKPKSSSGHQGEDKIIESFQLLDPKGYEPRVEKIEILIDRIRVESEGFDPNLKFQTFRIQILRSRRWISDIHSNFRFAFFLQEGFYESLPIAARRISPGYLGSVNLANPVWSAMRNWGSIYRPPDELSVRMAEICMRTLQMISLN